MEPKRVRIWIVVAAVMMTIGCGDDNVAQSVLEIIGTWDSNFGETEVITESTWRTAAVVRYDNDANYAITQNAADDMFSPNTFNRLVWTEPTDGVFYYCFVDFNLETQAAAESSTMTADDSDPDNTGCGGFSWTKLTLTTE